MIDYAEAATSRLNYELNNNDLRIQLTEIMKTIESYDAVDSDEFEKLLQVTGRSAADSIVPQPPIPRFNLSNPMPFMGPQIRYRRVYTRGELKMRESRQGPKVPK